MRHTVVTAEYPSDVHDPGRVLTFGGCRGYMINNPTADGVCRRGVPPFRFAKNLKFLKWCPSRVRERSLD
jgi:hypothetical protein